MEENRDLIEFNGTQVKVLIKNNTIEIEMNELAKAIGYADVIGIKKLIDSNPELKNKEFSYLKKVDSIENSIFKKKNRFKTRRTFRRIKDFSTKFIKLWNWKKTNTYRYSF